MKWFEQTQDKWITSELGKIKKTAKVSIDEAKNILEQRLLDLANTNGVSKEEAVALYEKLRVNQKNKTVA
jgi:hypothetical protein